MFSVPLCRCASRRVPLILALALGLAASIAGCNSFDPSQWTQEQVAKDISEHWDLVSIELKPTEGGYTGTGKSADGETFAISVKVDQGAKSVAYHGDGDRGSILDYSVRPEPVR